jgi:hypothetical protein
MLLDVELSEYWVSLFWNIELEGCNICEIWIVFELIGKRILALVYALDIKVQWLILLVKDFALQS